MNTPPGYAPPRPPPRRRRPRRWLAVAGAAGAAVVLIMIGVAAGASGQPQPAPAVTATATATATATVTAPAPHVTRTAHVTVTQTVTAAPPALTIARYTGTGQWNSGQFRVAGGPLTVKFSYTGNGSDGSADNFIADLASSGDEQQIANEIAFSGGKTTTLYPDTSSGDALYHLQVQATGSWSFTITQQR